VARISWAKVQQLCSAQLEAARTAASDQFAAAHVGEPNPLSGISARISVGGAGQLSVRADTEPDYAELSGLLTLEVNPEQSSEGAVFGLIDYLLDYFHKTTLRDATSTHQVHLTAYSYEPVGQNLDRERKLITVDLRLSGDVQRDSGTGHDDHLD
jgi:hypothetical protein